VIERFLRRHRWDAAGAALAETAVASTARSGSRLRKKFCRSFNFELQGRRASDDAHRALARAAPQLPARRGAAPTSSSKTVEDTLRQANPRLADVPGPLGRWNLNRAVAHSAVSANGPQEPAADPADGGGRPHGGVVPPGPRPARRTSPARSRSRTTSWCARPSTTRSRRRWTSTALRGSARERDGVRRGVTVHCVDTTEASVLGATRSSRRGRTAFLDDEELQNRRTNAVQLRRGLNVRSHLDRRRSRSKRIEQVCATRVTPGAYDRGRSPRSPELARSGPGPGGLAAELDTSWSNVGRRSGPGPRRGRALVHHRAGGGHAARADGRRARDRRRPCAVSSRSPGSPRSTTPRERDDASRGLGAFDAGGSRVPPERRPSRCRAATPAARTTEWVARRLLAPHALVLAPRTAPEQHPIGDRPRTSCAFLLRWQHVRAGGPSFAGGRRGPARRDRPASRGHEAAASRVGARAAEATDG